MPNLFIDLDGTLIDSRQRQYKLFMELATQCSLSFDEYWNIKRTRVNQETMLRQHTGHSDPQAIRAFHTQWMQEIEKPQRLLADNILPGSVEFLKYAVQRFTLYLVTARQDLQQTSAQIERFGWTNYFKALLVTQQRQSKASLIATVRHGPDDIMIGDTGEDVIAAREAGIRSIAVCSGILSMQILSEYKPDLLIETLMTLMHDSKCIAFLGN